METLKKIFREIQPNSETRHVLLQILATGLSGICIQKFISFIGSGRNGKGLINSLMLKLLGEFYGCDPNISILCQKQKSGGLPEMACLGWKRYARFGEPDENLDKMNWGICKGLTGGDPIKARFLNSNKTEYKNSLTLLVERQNTANILITGDGRDSASVDRMMIMEFPCHFRSGEHRCKHCKEGYCFPKNTEYAAPLWRIKHIHALFNVLSNVYYNDKLWKGQFNKSEEIEKQTKFYLNKCDEFGRWFSENYYIDKNDTFSSLKDIMEQWKTSDEYCGLNTNMKRSRGKDYVFERLRKEYRTHYKDRFKNKRKVFMNICFKDDVDDYEEYNNDGEMYF